MLSPPRFLGPPRVLGHTRVMGPPRFLGPHKVLGPHRVLGLGSSQSPVARLSGMPFLSIFYCFELILCSCIISLKELHNLLLLAIFLIYIILK